MNLNSAIIKANGACELFEVKLKKYWQAIRDHFNVKRSSFGYLKANIDTALEKTFVEWKYLHPYNMHASHTRDQNLRQSYSNEMNNIENIHIANAAKKQTAKRTIDGNVSNVQTIHKKINLPSFKGQIED